MLALGSELGESLSKLGFANILVIEKYAADDLVVLDTMFLGILDLLPVDKFAKKFPSLKTIGALAWLFLIL